MSLASNQFERLLYCECSWVGQVLLQDSRRTLGWPAAPILTHTPMPPPLPGRTARPAPTDAQTGTCRPGGWQWRVPAPAAHSTHLRSRRWVGGWVSEISG